MMTMHPSTSFPSLDMIFLELKPCDYNMIVFICMTGDRKCLVLSMEAVARVDHLKLPRNILWLWFLFFALIQAHSLQRIPRRRRTFVSFVVGRVSASRINLH
jgi:hypothetical protein